MVRIHRHKSLALLSLSLPLTSAMIPAFSFSMLFTITGTLTHPPYGIPPSDFAHAISSANNNNPISNASFPVTGYNTSIPAGPDDATGNGITGWHLTIDVAANVPLTNATDFFLTPAVKKTNVTEVATLSLSPPSALEVEKIDEDSWRVCAVVFTGGLSDGTIKEAQLKGGKLDGTCDMYLPSECIQGLQVSSVANNTAGKGSGSGCQSLEVPDACGKSFVGNVGDGYEINSTNSNQINGNKQYSFFAGASAPTSRDNPTAVMDMERMVWPVVITWTHFSTSGEVHDSAGWLSCVTAPNVTNPDRKTSKTNGGRVGREKSMWALVVALVLTGAITF